MFQIKPVRDLSNLFNQNPNKIVPFIFGAILFFCAIQTTNAATFTVTKTADTNDGVCNSDCSLREAIAAANAAGSDDVVNFDENIFSSAQTITLTGGAIPIFNQGSLIINGFGVNRLTLTANLQSRIFNISMPINPQFTVTINDLTIAAGSNGNTGGCIYKDSGTLTINNSVIKNCTAGGGGGIYNSLGTLIINNSTISGNSAQNGGGIAGGGTNAVLMMTNSTVSGNTANEQGGGIANQIGTTATLTNVTVASNTAGESGGGIYNFFNGTTTNLKNSIVAQNNSFGTAPDFSGTLTSQGYNLIGTLSGATVTGNTTGNITGQNPLLSPLQDNGGEISTRALLPGSPAIDAADAANFPPTDQRGVPRPLDGDLNGSALPDIGAIEAGAKVVTKTADTNDGFCNTDCSLREAIAEVNSSTVNDVILFSSLFSTAQTVILSGSELSIANNGTLTINGTGRNFLKISGNDLSRVLRVNLDSTAILKNLTITDGNTPANSGGGGIYNDRATLTIINCVVSNSESSNWGGGISNLRGNLTIENSTVTENDSVSFGGGIYMSLGTLAINNSTITYNSAGISSGGGIYISDSTTTINDTIISNNSANGGGGLAIGDGTAVLNNVSIANNIGSGLANGGNTTVNNSRITGNTYGANGGGITCFADLTLTNTTVSFNNSTESGGGIFLFNGNLNVISSTINNNSAGLDGGGIDLGNDSFFTNSTISNNSAGRNGGGMIARFETPELRNTTVAANSANSGGGVYGAVNAGNSLFADNTDRFNNPSDIFGSLISYGYNLIETTGTNITGTTTGNILGQDPQLLPIRNNGGTTQTVGLQPTSPAIDAGDPNNFPATDQRGIARPQDGDLNGTSLPDIGAYERQVFTFTVTKTADTNDGNCNADCSLREAIAAANAATTPDNAILFSPTVFAVPQVITLSNGQLSIVNSGTLAIYGTGANLLTISGNNQTRVLLVGGLSSLTISGMTISGGNGAGTVNSGLGGGIYNGLGFLTVVSSIITGNTAADGGGIHSGVNNSSGTLRVVNSVISGNSAVNNGGGVLAAGGKNDFINSVISGNSAGPGGGIYSFGGANLNLSNTRVINNSRGGIYISSNGAATINDSTIAANTGDSGIYNAGNLNISRSLLNANTTPGRGGAILNDFSGVITMSNTTVSGNFAEIHGGGIFNGFTCTINFINSTIVQNRAAFIGGGVFNSVNAPVNARNTIFADNTAVIQSPDFERTLTSQGYNLIENINGTTITGTTTGNILNVDPWLDPILRENGGATKTHALRLGSVAVDKGSAATGITTDQRGLIRPFDFPSIPNASGGNGSDIGAFERQTADIVRTATPFDFDGDGKTDISIFRPSVGEWWINRSSSNQTFAAQFGQSTDKPTPADFTGDGKTDIAFWRPTSGEWFILRSEDFSFFAFPFGTTGDVPVPADYDGDGKADAAVFRPSTLTWFIQKSSGGTTIQQFGAAGDVPTPADYDGDGKADIAIFRANGANGAEWWINRSSNNSVFAATFGNSTDKAVQGDYTGDGKADIAVWRPSNGNWFVLRSEDFSFFAFPFGANADIPAPGDYDGDGKTDAAVFRPSNTTWFVQRSTAGILIQQFGIAGDVPLPSAFVP